MKQAYNFFADENKQQIENCFKGNYRTLDTMKTMKLKLVLLFCLLSVKSFSQTDSTKKTESYFRFFYDNDFFAQTDRYYTQGTRPEFIFPFLKYFPLSRTLIPIKKNAVNYYGLGLQQDGFTPISIRHSTIFYGERPYASVAYLSSFLISMDKERLERLTTSIDLGVIGPWGGGEQEQKAIHKSLVNIQPLGWEYQIANDYVINYDLLYEKGLIEKKHFEMIGLAGFRAGTLYDDVESGLLFRAGRLNSYFENLGLQKHSIPKKKFHCVFYAKGEVKVVAYNATMQGGFFNKNSIYTISNADIDRIVATTSAGIILSYKRFSLEFGRVYITPEFRNGLDHGWGHVVISTCF